MKYINVIDLDNTLLPYDSFKKYIFLFLFKKKSFLKIFFTLLYRKIRLLNRLKFKEKIILITLMENNYEEEIDLFVDKLIFDVRDSVLSKINLYSNKSTVNVLVTASYNSYANKLANRLGWDCIASHFDQGNFSFVHVYGTQKIKLIKKKYPPENYKYNFAISDSNSDHTLLEMFAHKELIKK